MVSKRHILLATAASILFSFGLSSCTSGDVVDQTEEPSATHIAYVGTYSGDASEGIYAYRFDAESGDMESLGLVAGSINPNFLALHPSGDYLYSVNREDPETPSTGSISAYRIDRNSGNLEFMNKVDAMGQGPCHIAVDHTGRFLFTADYPDGITVSYRLAADGSLAELASVVEHEGSSISERQEAPHAHGVYLTADNQRLIVPDLGADRVVVYQVDQETGELSANDPPAIAFEPGTGPRHFTFHPDGTHGYVIGELASTVSVLSYDSTVGEFGHMQAVPTLPEGFDGINSTAEIEVSPDGRFVYGSNRGHNSIAVFAVDPADKTLTPVGWESTQGETPRHFAVDPTGAFLFAENRATSTIVQFSRDFETGALTPTGLVLNDAPAPVCMVFLPPS